MNGLQTHIYDFGDFRIDAAKRLLLKRDGERVPLTPKAFDTLLYLVEHSGTLLDKDELLRAVWADNHCRREQPLSAYLDAPPGAG